MEEALALLLERASPVTERIGCRWSAQGASRWASHCCFRASLAAAVS